MGKKRLTSSAIAAMALSAAIAVPAMAAAPTYSGTLTCVRVSDGDVVDLETLSGASKKVINDWGRFWTGNGYCEKGSVDSSGLTKDA